MSKFFLFRKEAINGNSSYSSDTGVGISSMAIPASSLAFISATKGKVFIYFNNTGIYEDNGLSSTYSMEKARVELSCVEGSEHSFIEAVLRFVSSGRDDKPIMKFDHVDGYSSFSEADVSNIKGLKIIVPESSVFRTSEGSGKGVVSSPPPSGTVLDGIDFATMENYPYLDYNPLGITDNGLTISAWSNAGLGGTDYDLSPVGTVRVNAGSTRSGSGIKADPASDLDTSNYFDLANAYRLSGEYTIYMAFGIPNYNTESHLGALFGSDDNTCTGPFNFIDVSTLAMRHYTLEGDIAKDDSSLEDGTVGYTFPDIESDEDTKQTCYVLVIRRDKDFNIYMHNHQGDIVAELPAVVGGTVSTEFRTDGDLYIETLGTSGTNTTDSFNGNLARFGVIETDIGANVASTIAVNLYDYYNPLT